MDATTVERQIIDAIRYIKLLPDNMRPGGYQSYWPDFKLLEFPREVVYRDLSSAEIDLMDKVVLDWLGPKSGLSVYEKKLVWAKCANPRIGWRRLAGYIKKDSRRVSYETLRLDYWAALWKIAERAK